MTLDRNLATKKVGLGISMTTMTQNPMKTMNIEKVNIGPQEDLIANTVDHQAKVI